MDRPLPHAGLARHLPNLITCVRIVLVAPLIVAVLGEDFRAALWIAAIAGLSDAIDGFLARHFGWRSRLGGWLDPLADKLLLVAAFLTLAQIGRIAWPLAWLVLARDLVIVTGALAYQRVVGDFDAQPSLLSKTNTLVQILYVLVVLFAACFAWHLAAMPLAWPAAWLVAALTIASGLDYLWRWGARARRVLRGRGGR